jgi:hypothetical protein
LDVAEGASLVQVSPMIMMVALLRPALADIGTGSLRATSIEAMRAEDCASRRSAWTAPDAKPDGLASSVRALAQVSLATLSNSIGKGCCLTRCRGSAADPKHHDRADRGDDQATEPAVELDLEEVGKRAADERPAMPTSRLVKETWRSLAVTFSAISRPECR